jgi:VWFA-related protein
MSAEAKGENEQSSPANASAEFEGLHQLDVLVTDGAGNAVPGLERNAFTLLDNGQPQKIVSFRSFHAASAEADPTVSIILLIDTLDLPSEQAHFERKQVSMFLRQNSGHLAHSVAIYSLDDSGLFFVAHSSLDGNELAADVDSDRKL